jgi:hypothetical protein
MTSRLDDAGVGTWFELRDESAGGTGRGRQGETNGLWADQAAGLVRVILWGVQIVSFEEVWRW